ncbi:multicopper oxidase family protein [Corynebacterium sp. YIM 101645]|uniref:Multicopper oxidase family protein n=1 Tax=Corynebacterium lemuris TaxID=1859292 RepID=A0ABT2FUJ1_9CORY|nr:multicopper oxidase family protein [Corynebacterium lemuris]
MSDRESPTIDTPPAGPSWSVLVRRVVAVLFALILSASAWMWWDSRYPALWSAAPGESSPTSAHGHHPGTAGGHTARDITTFQVDPAHPADVRVELKASTSELHHPSGRSFRGYTLNGTSPGPEIRARRGDLVEVVLHNIDIAEGTTLHWHGINVPAAMDGVAGVTQDAVTPGESFTYRFLAEDAGTYWYHSHQVSHRQVLAGLFGAIIIEPAETEPVPDTVMLLHTYPGGSRTINTVGGQTHVPALPGETMRVRTINTDNLTAFLWVPGAQARLLAIDGVDRHEPGPFRDLKVRLAAGARADLEVTVPEEGAVRVQSTGVSLLIGPAGATAPEAGIPAAELDLLTYGSPAPTLLDAAVPHHHFDYIIGQRIGFLDGRPGYWWTINGKMGRHAPMYVVREGDVVAMHIRNRSVEAHPMHLHGHHVLVTARDGIPATGSPWWTDSLDVDAGESYDIVFLADNPGVWMDHCHNLPHAVEGLMTHLSYEGVSTPFLMGRDSGNAPE